MKKTKGCYQKKSHYFIIFILSGVLLNSCTNSGTYNPSEISGYQILTPKPGPSAQIQKEEYKNLIKVCLDEGVSQVHKWGLYDDESGWRRGQHALLFDENLNPKPAYYGIQEALIEFLEKRQKTKISVNHWKLDGNANDYAGNVTGVNKGATFTGGLDGQCADVTTGNIAVGPLNLGNQFTISIWAYINSSASGKQTLIASADSNAKARGLQFYVNMGDSAVYCETGNGRTVITSRTFPKSVLFLNRWHHFAFAADRKSGRITIYIDGIDKTTNYNALNDFSNDLVLNLGQMTNGTNKLNGKIDEVRVYDGILNLSDITKIYRQFFDAAYPADKYPRNNLPSYDVPLTYEGHRSELSADGKKVLYVDFARGHCYELDLAKKETVCIDKNFTLENPGWGYFRAYYLHDGNYLLAAGSNRGQVYLHVLDKSLTKPPVNLGVHMSEGCAVARNSMHIAYTVSASDFYSMEIAYDNSGKPYVKNNKFIVNKATLQNDNQTYDFIETQNFILPAEENFTFTNYINRDAHGQFGANTFIYHTKDNTWANIFKSTDGYGECEGIWPGGNWTFIECSIHKPHTGTTYNECYRLKLDGSTTMERMTYFSDSKGFKTTDPIISLDGKIMVHQESRPGTDSGTGFGLYIMDLVEAGFYERPSAPVDQKKILPKAK